MRRAHGVWLLAVGVWLLPIGCTSDPSDSGQAPDSGSSGATGGRASGGSAGKAGTTGVGGAAAAGGAAGGGAAGGGTSGATGRDAEVDGPEADTGQPPQDPCTTARFCEGFEGFAIGAAPSGNWTLRTNRGAISVVGDQKHAGAKSAKFMTEQYTGAKTAFIRLASAAVFPVPGNVFYGRMMFRLESAPDTAVHWTFIQASGMTAQAYNAIYRYGGQHPITQGTTFVGNQLMANYETSSPGPASDCWHHANKKVVPVGRWACAEWQFDGPANTLRMWLDGAALDDLTVQGKGQGCVSQTDPNFTWTAPNFGSLDLGWESYQGDAARTLYIDDVVLDTKRIGCPAVTQ